MRPAKDHAAQQPYVDPVIEAYKKDVDRTLIRECLRRSPEDRLIALEKCLADLAEMGKAMKAVDN